MLLLILNEECLEVGKEVTKSLRFGLDDWEPGKSPTDTNRRLLTEELTDLIAVAQMLLEDDHIDNYNVLEDIQNKKDKVEHYLIYSKNKGIYKD